MKMSYFLNVVVILIFCCTGIAFSDDWKDESGKGDRDKPQYYQHDRDKKKSSDHRGYKDDKKGHDTYRHDDHKKRPDYHKHNGYRERPYQKNRHYRHHEHKGHRYEYQGHWKSWEQWDRYAKDHPDIYKHGDYYREDAHLMFRFCEPGTGACFFFSIGK